MNRIFKLFEEETVTIDDIKKAAKKAGLKIKDKITEKRKIYRLYDPKNKRDSTAREFAKNNGGEFSIGNSNSGTTPTVYWGRFELRFKNMKSSSGNQGHAYEKEMIRALKEKDLNKNEIKKLIEILDIEITDIYSVRGVGKEANKRNIIWELLPEKFVLRGHNDLDSIAQEVADITIIVERDNKFETYHISNKTSRKASFVNSGIGAAGPENKKAKKILQWLGADLERYIKGFEEYESQEGEKEYNEDFTPKASNKDIVEFLNSAIGQGYIYMHPQHTFMMDSAARDFLTRNPRNYKIGYPGINRKLFQLQFETDGLKKVSIQLRHTRGKTWPNTILCYYIMR